MNTWNKCVIIYISKNPIKFYLYINIMPFNNKEYQKEYQKKYRAEHREELQKKKKEYNAKIVICQCGVEVSNSYLSLHRKGTIHKLNMEAIERHSTRLNNLLGNSNVSVSWEC